MWTRKKETQEPEPQSQQDGGGTGRVGTINFDDAAARTTAQAAEVKDEPQPGQAAAAGDDRFLIAPEWATEASKYCFWPASRFIHPEMAISEEQALKVSPKMQKALQVLADKFIPKLLGRMSNRAPELFDLLGALCMLHVVQYNHVQAVIAEEEARLAAAKKVDGARVDGKEEEVTLRATETRGAKVHTHEITRTVGERLPDGSRVI